MNCPECHHSLSLETFEHISYHTCKQCQGIWVDANHLKLLAVRMGLEFNLKADKMFSMRPREIDTSGRTERIRPCPTCQRAMKQLNFAYDSNVYIDRCDPCDGIWLDGGEIHRIAKYVQIDEDALIAGRALIDLHRLPDTIQQNMTLIAMVIYVLARWWLRH